MASNTPSWNAKNSASHQKVSHSISSEQNYIFGPPTVPKFRYQIVDPSSSALETWLSVLCVVVGILESSRFQMAPITENSIAGIRAADSNGSRNCERGKKRNSSKRKVSSNS